MSNQKALALLQKYLDGKATFEEKALIDKWYSLPENIEDAAAVDDLNMRKEQLYQQIVAEMNKKEAIIVPFYKRSFFRVAGAATIIILLSIGAFFIYNNKQHNEVAGLKKQKPVSNDVAPGGNKAILTLADGSTIVLDNAVNGSLAEQGNSKIVKLNNGQLAYNTLNEKPTEIVYNTISTPRGGQYQLTLADGSKVWLNAASTLRFPATFSGSERKVELIGEGYFEVAKNAAMPFKVDVAGKGEVEVLGTHFNINAYSDEATINTTLLEGKVKVTSVTSTTSKFLNPGEQAQQKLNGHIVVKTNVAIDEVMAWKNGIFNFNNATLEMVLRHLSRWYDVDIIFNGAVPQRTFGGEMQKNLNLSQVLRILERNKVQFRIEGKNLIVL